MRIRGLFLAVLGLAASSLAVAQTPAPAPAPVAPDPQNILNLDLSNGGRVQVLLRPEKAPLAVARVKTLAARGFYDGLIFHRVIDGFMAQGGDPKGTGEGGSDLPDLKAEFNDLPHVRGVMSMARAQDENSANSQFFIMLAPNLRLDGKYTAIGRVISGMQYVDAIEKGEPPANPTKIVHAAMAAPGIAAPAEAAPAAVAAAPAAPVSTPPAITTITLPPSTVPSGEAQKEDDEEDAAAAAVKQVLRDGVEKDEKKR